ncbi:MAG: 2-oxoacid:ferredoxin oxidoreductase subunit beta [Magnetococcales bacterium]|nr:2-oxoacid:ferredoxin oxidoreductase subunit beta [Magnetococcales bacterium]MBF0151258.1 2-oxoacid:ferredoxin oxidoreductase subunit beta [Magnetococcales bacterium]MBF0174451.1 2-oxoacid:ferredoxin oxidoreductase subunit beta [Magnetococcales bacterium]MBF0347191.1 2-oxoacid:ferredoxin oxidoreductase subunit beta [Magnetococcales bacterium]MBF0631024.1 2-oxoacid:ferredoxin oxidoreductase subunit beta [Magnetococcales bacterium]
MFCGTYNKVDMKPADYKSEVPVVWCPGCGHYGILNAIYRALAGAGVDPSQLICISGIGCSSRTPYFLHSYKMHTLHGRAGPVATGAQLARSDLTVMVLGGDGDGFSIGGGHMPHMARKNCNLTYVLFDNGIYGLTKGQYSPTSRPEMKAYTTPYGGPELPMNPLLYMLTYGATYVAQGFAGKPSVCADLIKGGLEHQGFAYINIYSQCPSFNSMDTVESYREMVEPIPKEHDVTDLGSAMALAYDSGRGRAPMGLLYQVSRPTLDERMEAIIQGVGGRADYDINRIIDQYRP